MKLFFRLILLMCFSLAGAQENLEYQVDKSISVKIPGEVIVIDTLKNNIQTLQYGSHIGNDSFLFQRIKMDSEIYNNIEFDKEGLESFYNNMIIGTTKVMERNNFKLINSFKTNISGFLAYGVIYGIDGNPAMEQLFLVYEEYIYTAGYANLINFDKQSKERFLSSIVINVTKPGK